MLIPHWLRWTKWQDPSKKTLTLCTIMQPDDDLLFGNILYVLIPPRHRRPTVAVPSVRANDPFNTTDICNLAAGSVQPRNQLQLQFLLLIVEKRKRKQKKGY